jgi:hypothetical protein
VSDAESAAAAVRDARWLWFSFVEKPMRLGRSNLLDDMSLLAFLPELEADLAQSARANRRSLLLFVAGMGAFALLGSISTLLLYQVLIPAVESGRLDAELGYRIVIFNFWLPFVALVPIALSVFFYAGPGLRVSRGLHQLYVSVRALQPERRSDVVAAVQSGQWPRLARFAAANRWWRAVAS